MYRCYDFTDMIKISLISPIKINAVSQKVCDFKNTCSDGSDEMVCGTCDFERGGCGWINDDSADFRWTYAQGATWYWDNKPATDHTFKNSSGHFLYIEREWPQQEGQTARVMTRYKATEYSCVISLWYITEGDGVGTLRVYINSSNHDMK